VAVVVGWIFSYAKFLAVVFLVLLDQHFLICDSVYVAQARHEIICIDLGQN
jgi:hypothetical protein